MSAIDLNEVVRVAHTVALRFLSAVDSPAVSASRPGPERVEAFTRELDARRPQLLQAAQLVSLTSVVVDREVTAGRLDAETPTTRAFATLARMYSVLTNAIERTDP